VTVTATSVVQFDNPSQAGLTQWPALVIRDVVPAGATGFSRGRDYSTIIRDKLARELPGVWERYTFGYEPRIYTFKETITFHPGGASPAAMAPVTAPAGVVSGDLVMGISISGPRYDYAIEYEWKECFLGICVTLAAGRAGFELDWDIGLRLPVAVGLSGPEPLYSGWNTFTVGMMGLDWTAAQYQQVGLEPVGGNEFLLQYVFFLGAKASIAGVEVVNWALEAEYDGSRSFQTPLGPGAAFPIPTLDLSPSMTGLSWDLYGIMSVGIGLTIAPHLGTTGITADWQAEGDAQGSGSLSYNGPGAQEPFASINIANFNAGTNDAQIHLNTVQYHFSEFQFALGGYLTFELFGYGVRSGTFYLPAIDLSSLTGGLWINTHPGTPAEMSVSFPCAKRTLCLPAVQRP